jgi:hypothetical protein
VGVCVATTASAAESSSCAIRTSGRAGGSGPAALLGLAALGFAGWRRRTTKPRR